MEKVRKSQVKSFQFSDLESTHVVSQNAFKPFEFQTLAGESVTRLSTSDDQLRAERTYAEKNNFKIDGTVSDHRGISRQEQTDIQRQIEEEVKRRLEAAYNDAYNEGLEKGREEGREAALQEFHEALGQKVEDFAEIVTQVQGQTEKVLEKNRLEVYEFIKRFTKWIVMKEINEKVYLESLLEKLILELNARKNLIIKVGRENFAQMPEVIKIVEGRLGQLSNVRVEIVPEIKYPGIILEAENGLIDGSLEGVFQNIDKVFQQVLNHE